MAEEQSTENVLNLNLKEGEEAEYKIVRVDPSTSVRILCSVEGETHANSDLGWVRNGQLFGEDEETVVIEEIKQNQTAVKILQFENDHVGEYECTVKRPKGKYQKAKIRLDIKPTSSSYDPTAYGEIPCTAKEAQICQNDGICYKHEESKSLSCRCIQNTYGKHCEYTEDSDVDIILVDKSGGSFSNATIAAGAVFSITALVFALIFGFFCWKKSRQNREINRNYDDFLEKANEPASLRRNNSSNFTKNLEKKFHKAVERVNSYQPSSPTKKTCQNCTLPYMRWSDSALSLKSNNEQNSRKQSQSFEQISPKHTIVYMGEQNRPQVHELNCCKFSDIV